MDGVPAASSGSCMLLRPLYRYCYDSRFSGCTILLVCVFVGLGLTEIYHFCSHFCATYPMQLGMVCGDFNAHTTEWLCHSHTTDVAGLFCQGFAMTQDLTHIVDLPTHVPDRDDHRPFLLDLFLCSNPDSSTVASHSPLGKSEHMVVGVDMNL